MSGTEGKEGIDQELKGVKIARYLLLGNLALNEVTECLQCSCSSVIYHLWTESKMKEHKQKESKAWAALGGAVLVRGEIC